MVHFLPNFALSQCIFEQKHKISTAEMGAHRQKRALNDMVLELLID